MAQTNIFREIKERGFRDVIGNAFGRGGKDDGQEAGSGTSPIDDTNALIRQYLEQLGSRQTPSLGDQSRFRGAQDRLISDLQGVASGAQMGAGQMGAQDAIRRALAAQSSQAAGVRGPNAILAQRQAARNSANVGVQGAGQQAQAAAQDQAQARAQLGQVAGQARGQDMQRQVAELDARLRQMGMNDQARQALISQLMGGQQFQEQMAFSREQWEAAQEEARRQMFLQLIGRGLQAAGTAGGFLVAGPPGAAAGNAAGGAVTQAITPGSGGVASTPTGSAMPRSPIFGNVPAPPPAPVAAPAPTR